MKSIRHKLIYLVFSIAAASAILSISVFFAIYKYLGINEIFSERMNNNMQKTVEIGNLYLQEHINIIQSDIILLQKELEKMQYMTAKKDELDNLLFSYSNTHNIAEAIIFNKNGNVLASNMTSFSLTFSEIPFMALKKANEGEIYLRRLEYDRVHAIVKLDMIYPQALYLLLAKKVDENIVKNIEATEKSAKSFSLTQYQIERAKQPMFLLFFLLYFALFSLFIIVANRIASQIIRPLNILSVAASKIRDGNYKLNIEEKVQDHDFANLCLGFQRMSDAIKLRENKLKKAGEMIEERMNFADSIITQISSGLVLLHEDTSEILMKNEAALRFFINAKSTNYKEALPEVEAFILELQKAKNKELSSNITVIRDGRRLDLLVKAKKLKKIASSEQKILLTLNDMTAISSAERIKAWADVAQKVAHEIKNPLTPIQLSIERIQTKFLPKGEYDRESFMKYTNTVINRVDDIQQILSEFLYFARIPLPKMKKEDMVEIINESILLEKNANLNIKYRFDTDMKKCYVLCDRMQLSQVFTNLLKNSAEAIYSRLEKEGDLQPLICVQLTKENDKASVQIIDNGCGIKEGDEQFVHSPYFTTKNNGSGIGLSIVNKIMSDHGADSLSLKGTERGTVASFSIKIHC